MREWWQWLVASWRGNVARGCCCRAARGGTELVMMPCAAAVCGPERTWVQRATAMHALEDCCRAQCSSNSTAAAGVRTVCSRDDSCWVLAAAHRRQCLTRGTISSCFGCSEETLTGRLDAGMTGHWLYALYVLVQGRKYTKLLMARLQSLKSCC
jgi:hypothetical protein